MQHIPVRHITATLPEPAFTGSFCIRALHDMLTDTHMVQALHRHSFFYLLVLDKACGKHSIDFTDYPITDHGVYFMRPGQVHALTLEAGATGYLLEFTPAFYAPLEKQAGDILRTASQCNYYQLAADHFEKLRGILADILEEYTSQQDHYQEVIASALNHAFITLLRQGKSPQAPNGSSYQQVRLEELLQLIETHFVTQKQVSFYAAQLHLTAYQLNTITKSTLGKTSSDVIIDYIILEAKRQLLATTNPINLVATQLGYEDISYFTRFFKKHSGHTPEAFRTNFK